MVRDRHGLWRRQWWRGALAGLLCALAAWGVSQSGLLRSVEDWLFDACFVWRGTRTSNANIVLIGIDDESLDELKRPLIHLSPQLQEVVADVSRQKAAAIGIDLIIPESLSDTPELTSSATDNPLAFGQTILRAGNVVLPEWKLEGMWLRPLRQWHQLRSLARPRQPTDWGFVNLSTDEDGCVRRQSLLVRDEQDLKLSFALALYCLAHQTSADWNGSELRIGNQRVPLGQDQQLPINYLGPPGSIQTVSFRDALAASRGERPWHVDLAGAIVILGVTAHSQQDYHLTPYANRVFRSIETRSDGEMAGTEIQAQTLATISDGAYIRQPPDWLSMALLVTSGAALGAAFAELRLIWGLALATAHHFGWKAVCVAAFTLGDWRLEVLPMLLVGLLTYAGTFAVRWLRLVQMLGVIKSPVIARAIVADARDLCPRGEERVISVLFADIRSFTTFSEAHSAQQVVDLLNEFFARIIPVIERHGGALNQFMGDGFMVLYNAPQTQKDHAARAVRTAAEMVRTVHQEQATWAELDFPTLRIGVGVNTGSAVVGTVGSPRRLDYTAIGDVINTAARIESENKPQGTEILISDSTYRVLPPAERAALHCAAESVAVSLKGKAGTLCVHRVEVS
jgi:adenylate cyclase